MIHSILILDIGRENLVFCISFFHAFEKLTNTDSLQGCRVKTVNFVGFSVYFSSYSYSYVVKELQSQGQAEENHQNEDES